MILLKNYLERNSIDNIIQIDEIGRPLFKLFSFIRFISKKIWILVLTKNTALDRKKYKPLFEIVYSDYKEFLYPITFDLVVLTSGSINEEIVKFIKNNKVAKRILCYLRYDENINILNNYKKTDIFILKQWIEIYPIPEKIKLFLARFGIFRNKLFKISVWEIE